MSGIILIKSSVPMIPSKSLLVYTILPNVPDLETNNQPSLISKFATLVYFFDIYFPHLYLISSYLMQSKNEIHIPNPQHKFF